MSRKKKRKEKMSRKKKRKAVISIVYIANLLR
jgi:hypothetical protein